VVAIDGSARSVLVYQEKTVPQAFSRLAPVYAVAAAPGQPLGPRQLLDGALTDEPTVRPYGAGAIAAWRRPGDRWGVAVERNGTFTKVAAPAGRGPSKVGEDFVYSRGVATAGRYAALIWTAVDGTIRVSVGSP
jgi:hypothetical protein